MSKEHDLTNKEIDDLESIVSDTLARLCEMADKHKIDRNSLLKYYAAVVTGIAEAATIQNRETNHTNADRIRNMSDEELAELLFDKSRCDNCFVNYNSKNNCPSLSSCYSRHLGWLQSEADRRKK